MKNEYVCVEIEKADDFIERIEELESRGFVTMSAGHADKGVWYAILRRDAHAQMTPKEPTGEFSEVLEAAGKIKEYCTKTRCAVCPFGYDRGYRCALQSGAPEYWRLEGRDGNV